MFHLGANLQKRNQFEVEFRDFCSVALINQLHSAAVAAHIGICERDSGAEKCGDKHFTRRLGDSESYDYSVQGKAQRSFLPCPGIEVPQPGDDGENQCGVFIVPARGLFVEIDHVTVCSGIGSCAAEVAADTAESVIEAETFVVYERSEEHVARQRVNRKCFVKICGGTFAVPCQMVGKGLLMKQAAPLFCRYAAHGDAFQSGCRLAEGVEVDVAARLFLKRIRCLRGIFIRQLFIVCCRESPFTVVEQASCNPCGLLRASGEQSAEERGYYT